MGLLLHRMRFGLFITQLLLNYYRIITGANSVLFTCPNPVLILAETCPNPVRAKTQKTDYPLLRGMALLFYPSKGIKSEIVASKSNGGQK